MRFRTVGNLPFLVLLAVTMIGSSLGFAADSTDKLTSLPLHPGLSFQQEVDSPVCGKSAKMILYDTPVGASLEEYITWHKQQLKNFHYVHKVWSNRAQEIFYSPDGA